MVGAAFLISKTEEPRHTSFMVDGSFFFSTFSSDANVRAREIWRFASHIFPFVGITAVNSSTAYLKYICFTFVHLNIHLISLCANHQPPTHSTQITKTISCGFAVHQHHVYVCLSTVSLCSLCTNVNDCHNENPKKK